MTAAVRKPRAARQAELVEPLPESRPATKRMADLLEGRKLRRLLLPAPALRSLQDKTGPDQERDHKHNVDVTSVWLTQIAEQGGRQEVDAAWQHLTDRRLKDTLYERWGQLRMQAERNFQALEAAVAAEQAPARLAEKRRQEAEALKKKRAEHVQCIAAIDLRLAELGA